MTLHQVLVLKTKQFDSNALLTVTSFPLMAKFQDGLHYIDIAIL